MYIQKRVPFGNVMSILLILMPILGIYSIPGVGGTISDCVLGIMCIYVTFKSFKGMKVHGQNTVMELLPFLIYLILNGIITMTDVEINRHLIYFFRTFMYYYVIIFGVRQFYNIKLAFIAYKYVAVLSTCWLFLQYIAMNFFHVYIPGYIEGFVQREDLLVERDYLNYVQLYRPRSFFMEPAHYAEYVVGFLTISLLLSKKKDKQILINLFLTFGILLSGSTTGLLLCALCWFFYLREGLKEKTISLKFVAMVMGGILVVAVFLNSSVAFILIERTFRSTSAFESRFSNFINFFSFDNVVEFLFGLGPYVVKITDLYGWLPGIPLLFKCFGIIGVSLLGGAYCVFFIKGSRIERYFILSFIILNIGTEAITTTFMLLFMPFIVKGIDDIERKNATG